MDRLGRIWSAIVLIGAAIGIFAVEPVFLRAEVLAQAGTATTLEIGRAKAISAEEIRDRGTRLRAELDKAFNALPDSAKAGHADEFTALVLPYISPGTALDDAVGILRAAGFTAPARPRAREEKDQSSASDWYAVVAEIPQFSGRVFGNVEAYVMLLPPEQDLAEYIGRRHRLMYDPRR